MDQNNTRLLRLTKISFLLQHADFKYLSQEFNGEQLNLVKEKGLYPYEYMDSFEKFFEDKLPDRCEFYSSLKDGCISEENECISEKKQAYK